LLCIRINPLTQSEVECILCLKMLIFFQVGTLE
jgi:hypothetical protein